MAVAVVGALSTAVALLIVVVVSEGTAVDLKVVVGCMMAAAIVVDAA